MLTVVTKHANFLETFALKSRTLLLKRVVAGGWSLTLHNFQWQSSPKNPPQKIPSLTFLLNVPPHQISKSACEKKFGRLSTQL